MVANVLCTSLRRGALTTPVRVRLAARRLGDVPRNVQLNSKRRTACVLGVNHKVRKGAMPRSLVQDSKEQVLAGKP